MKRKAIYLLISMMTIPLLILNSCRITKNTDINSGNFDISNYESLIKIQRDRDIKIQNYKASTKINIEVKGIDISSSMQVWGIKDKKMKLSLYPFPFVEAARVFIDENKIEFWDKINNLKLEKNYKDLSKELGIPVDYKFIEDIILGRVVNKDKISAHIENWRNIREQNKYEFELNNDKFQSRYITDNNVLVRKMTVSSINNQSSYIDLNIDEHQLVDDIHYFPSKEDIHIYSKGKILFRFDIDWRKIQANVEEFPNIDSNIPKELKQVDFDYIIKIFK